MVYEKKYYQLYSQFMEEDYIPTSPQRKLDLKTKISLGITQLIILFITLFGRSNLYIWLLGLALELIWFIYLYIIVSKIYPIRKMIKFNRQKKKILEMDKARDLGQKYSLLFFYGTLKSHFHWNHKYLSRAKFIGEAITLDKYPLVVGDCGVPYLLGDMEKGIGDQIKGEVWYVREDNLKGLDEYEGLSKGYYDRREINVTLLTAIPDNPLNLESGKVVSADVYVKKESSPELRSKQFLSEYTLDFHMEYYRPIEHILVKQEMYLLGNPLERD